MLEVLADGTYRHLFLAQVIALIGSGLLTVALGLLAYELAGTDAGVVLGTALAIKMVAYVGVAPIVGAFANQLPRRAFLIAMDLVRAAIALLLPFITEVWQIYVLIFLLQSASAAFTPTFQATIPDVLPDEQNYTRALSLSRLAYDLESLLSPALAAALLTVINFHWLFGGTVVGFLCSAALVLSVTLPRSAHPRVEGGIYDKTTRGLRIYLKTPRLRGLLALNLSVAAAGAMVIVNTVVIVRALLGRPDNDLAVALGCFGGGSMIVAVILPRVLDRVSDRAVMLPSALLLGVVLIAFAVATLAGDVDREILLITWTLLGIGYSAVQTPTGRLLRRSARPEDRPALFAAQFALSHACWLITYPLAGWLGTFGGISMTTGLLGLVTIFGAALAMEFWPLSDPDVIPHVHHDLSDDHPHLQDQTSRQHAHTFTIDDLHRAMAVGKMREAIGLTTKTSIPRTGRAPGAIKSQDFSVSLKPEEGTEVKADIKKGAKITYLWKVDGGTVDRDTHGAGLDGEVSYSKGRSVPGDEGELTAAFDGNHGWFWRNRGSAPGDHPADCFR